MVPIIGFGHRSRVGKDTAAKFLNTELRIAGIRTVHVGFADKLKEVTLDLYSWAGMKRKQHYEDYPADRQKILPELGMTPVEIWVATGNKLREVYDKTWIKVALLGQQNTQVIVVSDVRYPNEVDVIHGLGGLVFRIKNSRAPILDTVADNALEGSDVFDGTIENEGALADLHSQMVTLAEQVRNG